MKAELILNGNLEYETLTKGAVIVRFMGGDIYVPEKTPGIEKFTGSGEIKKLHFIGGIKKGNFCVEYRASEVVAVGTKA